MLKRALFAALAAVPLVMLTPLPASAVPMISVGTYTPPSDTTPFLVPIIITDAVQLTSWDFDLVYNPNDLQINDPAVLDPEFLGRPVTEGDFFSAGAPFNLLVPGFIDLDPTTLAQTGLLFGVHGEFGGFPGDEPSGTGVLAYVEFVKTSDNASVDSIMVTNQSTTSAVPEPATLALLAGGVIALLGVRRRGRSGELQGL